MAKESGRSCILLSKQPLLKRRPIDKFLSFEQIDVSLKDLRIKDADVPLARDAVSSSYVKIDGNGIHLSKMLHILYTQAS